MSTKGEKDAAMALVWGGGGDGEGTRKKRGGQKRKRVSAADADEGADVVHFDSDDEDESKAPASKKARKQKLSTAQEKERTLHMHLDNTTSRNDVRTLFEDYDPKVTLEKYAQLTMCTQHPRVTHSFFVTGTRTRRSVASTVLSSSRRLPWLSTRWSVSTGLTRRYIFTPTQAHPPSTPATPQDLLHVEKLELNMAQSRRANRRSTSKSTKKKQAVKKALWEQGKAAEAAAAAAESSDDDSD